MKRGMEKEKKGLFGRLLDFWKEKIGAGETKGIGFWNGARELENRFAEMGDSVSLKQEKKKAFWEEKVETVLGVKEETGGLLEQEKKLFFAEAEISEGRDSSLRAFACASGILTLIVSPLKTSEGELRIGSKDCVSPLTGVKRRVSPSRERCSSVTKGSFDTIV